MIYHGFDWYRSTGGAELLSAFDTMLAYFIKRSTASTTCSRRRAGGYPTWASRSRGLCAYEYDKRLDDLVRLRSWGVDAKMPQPGPPMPEGLAGAHRRYGQMAADEQAGRPLLELIGRPDTLRPELFTRTLDTLYASPRSKKLDYLSLNVCGPFGGPPREPHDADRVGSGGTLHDEQRGLSNVHPGDQRLQH